FEFPPARFSAMGGSKWNFVCRELRHRGAARCLIWKSPPIKLGSRGLTTGKVGTTARFPSRSATSATRESRQRGRPFAQARGDRFQKGGDRLSLEAVAG